MTTATTSTRATEGGTVAVQSLAPCLSFQDRCEEAMNFYVSLFPNSRIVSLDRWRAGAPIPEGKVMHAVFELNGREYRAFDGGEHFKFNDAFSFEAAVETQEEIDELWARLTADGGEPGPCGWLTDKFGVSWQVVPTSMERMMRDWDSQPGNAQAVLEAVLKMGKLDIKTLEDAYNRR